jgi:hypothetical protein
MNSGICNREKQGEGKIRGTFQSQRLPNMSQQIRQQ